MFGMEFRRKANYIKIFYKGKKRCEFHMCLRCWGLSIDWSNWKSIGTMFITFLCFTIIIDR